jgi:hypothetical protein
MLSPAGVQQLIQRNVKQFGRRLTMSDTLATSDKCKTCGKQIPALPAEDAECIACRYAASGKAPEDAPPSAYDLALDTVAAPEAEQDPVVRLAEDLQGLGVTFPDLGRAMRLMDGAVQDMAIRRAGEALAFILARLPGGRRGTELRVALLGTVDGDLAGQARRVNVAPQILWRSVERLRKRIFG